jgi:hypothetical protein
MITTKKEYQKYKDKVKSFFEKEGIANLTALPDANYYFSKQNCDCCNTLEGGDRIDANGYNPTTKQIQQIYVICKNCEYYAEYGQLDDMIMLEIEKDTSS